MITLMSPFESPVYEITLKNTEVGDNLMVETRARFFKAMSGQTYGYKQTPALKKHRLNWINLQRRTVLELFKFLENAAGKSVKYIDREGVVWKGMILTDPAEYTTTGPGNGYDPNEREEANDIIIEFEGVKIA